VESSLRPSKWDGFREDYRFTGKEDDVEVGLIYFGKRFYNPLLQRWISPDPLAIHAPGQADLNLYAYVHGKVLVAVDPVGLQARQAGVLADNGAEIPPGPDGVVDVTITGNSSPAPGAANQAQFAGGIASHFKSRMEGIKNAYVGAGKGIGKGAAITVGAGLVCGMMALPALVAYGGYSLATGNPVEAVEQLGQDLKDGPTPENGERVGELIGPIAASFGAPEPGSFRLPKSLSRLKIGPGAPGNRPPTFGNLYPGETQPSGRIVNLVEKNGRWYEYGPGNVRRRASGSYDFVVQDGSTLAVRQPQRLMGSRPGHLTLSGGGQVEYAGGVRFGSGRGGRGLLREWSNGSGHYMPAPGFESLAPFAPEFFRPVSPLRPPPRGPQLPVFQF
jgi:RHS repeat-associated protein